MSATVHDLFLSEAVHADPSINPVGLELRRPDEDVWAVILPNPAPGQGPYKLQFFSLVGLAGHRAYATPQAALRAAQREGYTVSDPGALNRLAASTIWRTAYAVPNITVPDR